MAESFQRNVSMISLELPKYPKLLQAIGRVALAHGQLEHILRMTIKALSGLSVQKALDATSTMRVYDLRKKIKKLFEQKSHDEVAKTELDALLNKAEQFSKKRNKLIHRPWAKDAHGKWVVKEEDHVWGPPPTAEELNQLAEDIWKIMVELNTARLKDFLKDALSQK
jgi:hypothetical protein